MGTVTQTWIFCNNCEKPYGTDNKSRNIGQHRAHAVSEGWLCNHHHDLCPGCRPAKRNIDVKRKIAKVRRDMFDADGYNKQYMKS